MDTPAPQIPEDISPALAPVRARIGTVLLVAAGWIAGWAVLAADLHTGWEDRMYFRLMELQSAPKNRDTGVVHIEIQDATDQAWPWPHLDYAILLHALAPYQPEILALDLPLDQPDTLHPVYERQLARQMRAFRDVVIAAKPSLETRPMTPPAGLEPFTAKGLPARIPFAGSAAWPIEAYRGNNRISLAAAAGPEDTRIPLAFRLGSQLVPAFPLVVFAKSLGAYWPHCDLTPSDAIVLRDYQGKDLARIPVDAQGRLRLAPARSLPPPRAVEFYTAVLSAEQMHQQSQPLFDLNLLRRQIVLVSIAHPDMATVASTPEGPAYPGSIHARVLQQLLLHEHRTFAPPWLGLLLILGGAAIATWAGSLEKTTHAAAALAGTLFFLVIDVAVAFYVLETSLPAGALATAVAVSWCLALAWRGRQMSAEPAPLPDLLKSPADPTPSPA